MKRERASDLAEQMLRRLEAGADSWPLRLVTELYVFGSFARGATEPHDLDIDVEVDNSDEEWLDHFMQTFTYGRDPHALLRRHLGGGSRSYQFQFDRRDRFDFPLTLLWRRGESISAALQRLHAIPVDPAAGRAPRDAMLPELDGLDRWIPRPTRQHLTRAVHDGAVRLERIELPDAAVRSTEALEHIEERWKPTSPLHRAGKAVLAHFEQRGIDLTHVHLHGQDVNDPHTPYYAGFNLRYFASIPRRFTVSHGVEWLEVVHPTQNGPLHTLRITPAKPNLLENTRWR